MAGIGAWPPGLPARGPKGHQRDPAVVLLLSFVTCGIYYLYWIYMVSDETRNYIGEPDTDPGVEVILSLVTCFMYTYYWDYKMGRKLAAMQAMAGVPVTDNAILYLVLNFFQLGFLPMLIQQGHLNEIWRSPTA